MPLSGSKEKLFQRYLTWIYRQSKINQHLDTVLPTAKVIPEERDQRKIGAAALQIKLELYDTPFDYIDEMHRRVREAAQAGARLVAFPEYNNISIFGMLPGIEKMEEAYGAKNGDRLSGKKTPAASDEDISLSDLFRYTSPVVESLVASVYSRFASAYGLYIMAGSYIHTDRDGSLVNRAYLFAPDGLLLGTQDKVHLLPLEEQWIEKRGKSFSVFQTTLGRLAMPVCMDATYYESFRILELQDTDIAFLPIANPEEYNYWLALRGIWPRVQECPLYGVKSSLVGSIAGLTYTGRAGIYAPLELTADGSGILAEVEPHDREAMAFAYLDLEALHELRRNHPWRDQNLPLYRKYFPAIYKNRL
ncbi:MAG: nitrilase-related carbon-nitrogen hydrolase [Bacillota bacterium]|nr:nitrilase-related carbon-nitrogen hydrolase [Bacillota bacterium]